MKAIILNLSAWVMLPIMDGFAKYLSSTLPVLQITWSRYFFTIVITLPIMLIFFRKSITWTEQPKLQLIRGLLLFCANILFFYSISIISLAKALTLAFIAPLIVTRKLHTSDNPLLTLLLTGIVGAVLGSIIMPTVWVSPTLTEWYMMFAIGFFASLGHLFIILSLRYADASNLAPFGYFEIFTNILIGYYFFNHFPDSWTFLGLFIIISSGIYIFRREHKISLIN